MIDVIPYKFVPYLGPFQGFNWESVTHIMPVSQFKIGKTYHRPSATNKRKYNKNSDENIDKISDFDSKNTEDSIKIDETPHQNSQREAVENFKKECVWWGWSILDPSQLGTSFRIIS